ncbi:hypothetical protein Bca52824_025739 [Brassica carinata]|uniref:Uncharacterized protein n=1 Tax=Brassica carinata TaxID=52824 RepID=A0A8X7VA13_BRACI|nr:hypothetical protein Bca52824_025739 [Brassica carinata]
MPARRSGGVQETIVPDASTGEVSGVQRRLMPTKRYDDSREDQLSEPEEDSKFGAGKRQCKRSVKLTECTADPRLKKLFDKRKG